jgi:hypothetical protein
MTAITSKQLTYCLSSKSMNYRGNVSSLEETFAEEHIFRIISSGCAFAHLRWHPGGPHVRGNTGTACVNGR